MRRAAHVARTVWAVHVCLEAARCLTGAGVAGETRPLLLATGQSFSKVIKPFAAAPRRHRQQTLKKMKWTVEEGGGVGGGGGRGCTCLLGQDLRWTCLVLSRHLRADRRLTDEENSLVTSEANLLTGDATPFHSND